MLSIYFPIHIDLGPPTFEDNGSNDDSGPEDESPRKFRFNKAREEWEVLEERMVRRK
jgi:hypothetical protein